MNIRLVKQITIVVVGIFLAKTTGFFREITFANVFGASATMDHYLIAAIIPTMLGNLAGALVPSLFTSRFLSFRERNDSQALKEINILFTSLLMALALLIAILEVVAPTLVSLLAPSLQGVDKSETLLLVRMLLPIAITTSAATVLTTLLQAGQRITVSSFIQVPINLIVIGFVWAFGANGGATSIVYALYASAIVQFILLGGSLRGLHAPLKPQLSSSKTELLTLAATAAPMILSSILVQAMLVTERYLGSSLTPGSVSYINYASKTIELPVSGIYVVISAILFPLLTTHFVNERLVEFRANLLIAIRWLMWLLAPAIVLIGLRPSWIVEILFQRGAFTASMTHNTAHVLQWYAFAIIPMLLKDLLNFSFFASNRFSVNLRFIAVEVIAYVLIGVPLVHFYGIIGIPIAFLVAVSLQSIGLLWASHRYHQVVFMTKQNILPLLKWMIVYVLFIFSCRELALIIEPLSQFPRIAIYYGVPYFSYLILSIATNTLPSPLHFKSIYHRIKKRLSQ